MTIRSYQIWSGHVSVHSIVVVPGLVRTPTHFLSFLDDVQSFYILSYPLPLTYLLLLCPFLSHLPIATHISSLFLIVSSSGLSVSYHRPSLVPNFLSLTSQIPSFPLHLSPLFLCMETHKKHVSVSHPPLSLTRTRVTRERTNSTLMEDRNNDPSPSLPPT